MNSRQQEILIAIIEEYVKTAEPVGSEELARIYHFPMSPATIRNVMGELEQDGYLYQPHISAGRIPTDKGYRYYVDFLVLEMQLLDEEKESILKEYKKEINRLEDALEETSEIISTITHYAGIVSLLDWQDKFFYKGISHILEQPEFQNFEKTRLLIKIIEDKQNLLEIINRDFKEKVKVYIGHELECPEMESCSLVVSSYRLKDKPLGRLAVLGPARMEYKHIIPALEYISDVLTGVLDNI